MTYRKHSITAILALLSVTSILSCFVWMTIDATVDRVVKREAEVSALRWVKYFARNIDNIEGLVVKGQPDSHQALAIQTAVSFGEVFRFKLFRPNGTISLVSDEFSFMLEGKSVHNVNTKALKVFRTGESHISVNDGTEKPNRPNLYVEAYVPVTNAAGKPLGVAEVYVDRSDFSHIIAAEFAWLAFVLPLLCALIYIIPSLASLRKGAIATAATAKAEHLYHFDGLTGLRNRRSFSASVSPFFGKPENTDEAVGMLYIDVDDFKQINDEFGHDGGDAFLRWTGRAIQDELGKYGIGARFGGDEFVVCLPNANQIDLRACGQRIMHKVAEGIFHRNRTISGKISVGFCLAPASQNLNDVLHAADLALYKSKEAGKNMITCYTADMNAELLERQQLERLLRDAADGTGLELHFQPINNPESGKILGFEALLRLRDEQGKIIPPADFIPLAEKLSLIVPIGNWVLEEAISHALTWPQHMFVSINLSPVQFEDSDLAAFIQDALTKYEFPAERMEVEVTESLLMGDDGNTQRQIAEIKALGVSVAMDDFGTGYSSLSYLWKYKFDKLKIDRSFLVGYDKDPTTLKKIIGTIVTLGKGIGMTVTVEGVESDKHVDMLADMRCDQLQGFYFGKPMPALDAAAIISAETLRSIPNDTSLSAQIEAAKADVA